MHVVVVGSGVIGAATALRLSREGHTAEVLEAGSAAAQGASFANAGLVSPGHCFSWGEPGVPAMVARSLLGISDDLRMFPPRSASMLRWGILFARECSRDAWFRNSQAALSLSAYSRDVLRTQSDVALEDFGGRHEGILYLYGAGEQPAPHESVLLGRANEPHETLLGDRIFAAEPTLRGTRLRFERATFCPDDSTGDAARFTRAALLKAVASGANVRFGQKVSGFQRSGNTVTGVVTSSGIVHADAVVVATGLSSAALLRTAGASVPLHPVTGYSASYRVRSADLPRVGAVSIKHKIAWASFGKDQIRFTGFADVGIPGPERVKARFRDLEAFAADVYPMLRGLEPERWVGQRPMTPDNLPYLGAGPLANLWVSCGHGAMGWTMACGSAQLVTDLIQSRPPAIDLAPFRPDRFGLLGRR